MGRATEKMLDEFDAEEDARERQERIKPRDDGEGKRKSARVRKVKFKGG